MTAQASDGLLAIAQAAYHAGRLGEAETAASTLVRERPDHAAGWSVLAETLARARNRQVDANAAYCRAVELNPKSAPLRFNHANLLLQMGRFADAQAQYRVALAHQPGHAKARLNLSNTLSVSGQLDAALAQLLELTTAQPDFIQGWTALAALQIARRDIDAAVTAARRAVAAGPGDAIAQAQLAQALFQSGEAGQSCAHFELAANLEPRRPEIGGARLFMLSHLPDLPTSELIAAHREWGRRMTPPRGPATLAPRREDNAGRIRVGYVSPDFHTHSVASFFRPVLMAHDRSVVALHAYYTQPGIDPGARDLAPYFDRWRNCSTLDDEALAQLVRDDGIDILIDLAGHTANNRLGVFALQPARLQWQWFGYPLLTGLDAFDTRLTDTGLDPPGHNPAGERLTYLPSRLTWAPAEPGPPVQPSPCLSGQPFTFGSFNAVTKMNAGLLDTWAQVLRAVPGSRLRMGHVDSRAFEHSFSSRLRAHGVDPGRVEFLPKLVMSRYLQAHDGVDLMFDSFPYNGGTTTAHALWRGVPVVTLAGDYGLHRTGASMLLLLGLHDLVVDSPRAYIDLCIALAAAPDRLQAWRATLRQRFQSSPLGQPRTVVRALETEMRRALGLLDP